MEMKKKKFSPRLGAERSVHRMVEDVVGCKWSTQVLQLVRQGVRRPGSMRQAVPGLTAKVLSERLHKLRRFGIVERVVYPEVPPHVEYKLTPFGRQFAGLLDAIERLDRRWNSGSRNRP